MCNYLSILRLEESVSINQFSLILSIRWLSPPLSHAFVICIRIVSEMAMTSFETSKASDKVYPLQLRHNARDGVLNHQPHDCLLNRLFRRRSKKTPKLRVTGLCKGNSPGTGEFPAQMASNAENISIWWRHRVTAPIHYLNHYWFCIISQLADVMTDVSQLAYQLGVWKWCLSVCVMYVKHNLLLQFCTDYN